MQQERAIARQLLPGLRRARRRAVYPYERMTHFSVIKWSTVVTLGVASSACLSDITWGDLPDVSPASITGSGGHAGSNGSPGPGGAGPADTARAGAGSAPLGSEDDAGVPREDADAPPPRSCSDTAACLSLSAELPLPAPCTGVRYSQPLGVVGGKPPYTWSLASDPGPQFALSSAGASDGRAVRIESIAPEGPSRGGVLRIAVEDASTPPARLEFDLDLRVRQSCWFAYLSETESRQLHLRDVFLQNDIALGSALDFEFSPDGNWLAFRQSTVDGDRLYIYRARAPRSGAAEAVSIACPEAALEAADAGPSARCDVLDYAWSEDSNQLAFVVSGTTPSQDFISGLSGFVSGAPGATWPWMGRASWVADDVPLDYHSELAWLESDRIAFLGEERSTDSTTLTEAPYVARIAPNGGGSAPPAGIPPLLTRAGAVLRRAANGVAVIEPAPDSESSFIGFYSPDDTNMPHTGWLSPSGSFVGLATDESELEVYDVHDADDPLAVSEDLDGLATSAVCEAIIAWSDPIAPAARERLACTSGTDLEFFEYDPSRERLEHLARVHAEPADGVRRAFSPDGRWFTFGEAGGGRFGLIDLDRATPRVDPTPIVLAQPPVELAYPPARVGLVTLGDAAGVAEYPLPGLASRPSAFTSEGSSPRSACVEAFWMSPAEWCGAPRTSRHLSYAPDAKSLLFESAAGQLSLAQPAVDRDTRRVTDALAACAGSCAARPFAFQPDLASEPDR